MRLGFLSLSAAERQLYIQEAANRNGLSPVIVEKDFWVCWMLGVLYQSPLRNHLVFKGGTSLSKVFQVIHRFSEDIDLSLSPDFLDLPPVGDSRSQADKWMSLAEAACGLVVQNQIRPILEAAVTEVLGRGEKDWLEFRQDTGSPFPVLLFHYPTSQQTGFEYLLRSVKLEFGAVTDQRPVGFHPVRPWLAEAFPAAFEDWKCEVVALELERTFWEKATILHAEFHRPIEKPMPDRYSRHYADTAALAKHSAVTHAISQHELRNKVVLWKSRFFGRAWANYDLAKAGTFCLVPPSGRLPALYRDYEAMRNMYLNEPPSFDEILEILASLEQRVNLATRIRRKRNVSAKAG